MRVFVAGGTGVLGRRLVPQLVARGHQATTRSAAKLGLLEQLGADGVVMDGLDAVSVGEAVAAARPEAIVHQMTAIAGKPDMKHPDRWFATTNRLRTEGTDHLLAAAEATGVSHVVAQSYASWNGIRTGGWVKTEEVQDPSGAEDVGILQPAAAGLPAAAVVRVDLTPAVAVVEVLLGDAPQMIASGDGHTRRRGADHCIGWQLEPPPGPDERVTAS